MTIASNPRLACIILAAGKGTRMQSRLPKVMHNIAGQPMIGHVRAAAHALSPDKTIVVVAPDVVVESGGCEVATQHEQKGTGHAVLAAMDALGDFDGTVLVLYGDTPLITTESLQTLLDTKHAQEATIALLAMHPENPTGYGRLVMPHEPFVQRIVECKDATSEEKSIRWVWGGVMAFDAHFLREQLPNLAPSSTTGEYYLTKLLEQSPRSVMVAMKEEEAMGVNDRVQLAAAEAVMQNRLRARSMLAGATMVDPASVYLCADTQLGRDVVVHPHVVFGAKVVVEDGVEIRAFSHIEGAHIGKNAIVGPFARLRPGSVLGEGAHVGNFVELKNTTLAKGAKANHLSYVGDATVGENANIGAGTITCNYDGKTKHKTTIGAHAFIGSNSALVAPVTIGEGAVVAAGSVITEDVAADTLAIARGRQVSKKKR